MLKLLAMLWITVIVIHDLIVIVTFISTGENVAIEENTALLLLLAGVLYVLSQIRDELREENERKQKLGEENEKWR